MKDMDDKSEWLATGSTKEVDISILPTETVYARGFGFL